MVKVAAVWQRFPRSGVLQYCALNVIRDQVSELEGTTSLFVWTWNIYVRDKGDNLVRLLLMYVSYVFVLAVCHTGHTTDVNPTLAGQASHYLLTILLQM